MRKCFNVNADCKPDMHYMIRLDSRLVQIKKMVDHGQYFTINRARQYGKTTTLKALEKYLEKEYFVISLDFQMMSYTDFESEAVFVETFTQGLLDSLENKRKVPGEILEQLKCFADGTAKSIRLAKLFHLLNHWCELSEKPLVLIIDEIDSATNNQVFLDFLSQLRGSYINRDRKKTFQSVILAGVYDVKNIKNKIRSDEDHKTNSPWNIAADFLVDMDFKTDEIAEMLSEYEKDHQTGMDIRKMAKLIYDYTSGYPYLVSRICKLLDERIAGSPEFLNVKQAWTPKGFLAAVNILLTEKNTLFESLIHKLENYQEIRSMLDSLLFIGAGIPYNSLNRAIELAEMFGFIKNSGGNAVISNRIFETVLYNWFLSEKIPGDQTYKAALQEKNQFIQDGHLNMELVLEKFVQHFDSLYGDCKKEFLEDDGRRYFLLYLRPIINGTGNYYVESRTRNMERTDVIIDYCGEQFVIEMKIWRGNAYHTRGEAQLADYLDYYHLEKGYLLSFNFNKKKEIGVKRILVGDKEIVEAVV